jgi:hypothetical protein
MPVTNSSTLKKRTNKPRSKDDAHYVDNKKFYQAFVDYHEKRDKALAEGKISPRLPDYIGECFMKIAEKFSHHMNFINYPYRQEMISDAIENCVLYAHVFDPKRGKNPFAYFSQVTWNAYIRRINRENKNKYVTYKSHQNQMIMAGIDSSSSHGGDHQHHQQDLYDNINTFIEDYERKAKDKRAEKKKRLAASKAVKTKK